MAYKVKLDIFEGPFDLLVYLIENARMSIYDIQVAEITSQYMEYIEKAKAFDIALTTEFMVLAAVLIEIKSRMLLPRTKTEGDGDMDAGDPRSELVARLLEYKRFKNAAELLEKCEEQAMLTFEKPKEDLAEFTGEPDIYLSLDIKRFVTAFNQFLQKKKRVEEIKKNYAIAEEARQTTEEKMDFIRSVFRVKMKRTINFKDLIGPKDDKYEVAATFAAILEMARLKAVKLKQPVPFGDIKITEGVKQDGQQENDKVSV
ncbi:MAG: segregation/condensation protein A [Clostridiales bacterium]|nr:segregation/condensation protein A [Clostridiales bacterium]